MRCWISIDFNQVHLKLFMFWDHKNRDRGTRLRGRKNASMRWTYKCLWCISSPEVGIRDIQYPRTKQHLGVTVWFPDKILRVDHGPKNVEELRCVTEVYNHHPSLSIIIYHHLDLLQVFGPLQLPRRPHPEAALSAKDQALSEKVRNFESWRSYVQYCRGNADETMDLGGGRFLWGVDIFTTISKNNRS